MPLTIGFLPFQSDDSPIDDLPPAVVERLEQLEPELLHDLRTGERDEIPQEVIEQLPVGITDQIPDSLLEGAAGNPGLTAILIAVGILCLIGAAWGAVKGFLKMAVFLAVVGGGAWFWFFVR